jgi:thiol-disulfide isomerase/thioredoxin
MIRAAAVAVVLLCLAVVGCGGSTGPPGSSATASCLPATPASPPSTSVAPASAAPVSASAAPALPSGRWPRLPGLNLSCLGTRGQVRLDSLGRPAVINLWASWCGPCRAELPAVQAYALLARDRLLVLGIDSGDTRSGGTSLQADLHLTFPSLADPQQRLQADLGRTALPVTVFADSSGQIRYVYTGPVLDRARVAALAAVYLGVTA